MTSKQDDQDGDDQEDARLLRQLRLARARPDGLLSESVLLAQLIARQEAYIKRMVRWQAQSLRPSEAELDEMVQNVRLAIVRDVERVVSGTVTLRAVIGRKIADERIELARRRKRRAAQVDDAAEVDVAAVEDGATLESEAVEFRARLAELPEREGVFLSERFFGGLRPDEIARRHGVHRRVVDTATSRALKKLLASVALADQRVVRNLGSGSGDGT